MLSEIPSMGLELLLKISAAGLSALECKSSLLLGITGVIKVLHQRCRYRLNLSKGYFTTYPMASFQSETVVGNTLNYCCWLDSLWLHKYFIIVCSTKLTTEVQGLGTQTSWNAVREENPHSLQPALLFHFEYLMYKYKKRNKVSECCQMIMK